MNGLHRLLLLAVSIAYLGCASAGSWNYEPSSPATDGSPVSSARVAVLPFEDLRGDENKAWVLLYVIPLMPVGPMSYDRIEGGSPYLTHTAYQIRPAEDLAKAVVAELQRANVFAEVFYTEREQEPGIDLILRGRVIDMNYSGGIISYGLSAFGPALWFVGLPAGYTTNRLEIELALTSPSGETLWESGRFEDEWKRTMGLYYHWGDEFEGYPELMQKAAKRWVEGLETHLRSTGAAR